jgi:hypothetical protein
VTTGFSTTGGAEAAGFAEATGGAGAFGAASDEGASTMGLAGAGVSVLCAAHAKSALTTAKDKTAARSADDIIANQPTIDWSLRCELPHARRTLPREKSVRRCKIQK